jgi:hypothetical protein
MREQIAHPDDTVAVVGVKPIKGNEASDSAHAGRPSRPSSIAAVYPGSYAGGQVVGGGTSELAPALIADRAAWRRRTGPSTVKSI